MMMHEGHPAAHRWWPSRFHHHREDLPPPKPNGSITVSLILRLCALMLSLSSAIVMAASNSACAPAGSGSGSGAANNNITYARFDAFVLLVGCTITSAILEAVALYLQIRLDLAAAAADPDDKSIATDMEEEEEEMGAPGMVLVVLDHLIPALLFPAMGASYYLAGSACSRFSAQVEWARVLALAACAAVTLAGISKAVPLRFNLPPVL